MTTGIYCLKFNGTEKVYIGQSINIEKRYKQHRTNLLNSTATIKLLDAYSKYGMPSIHILLVCDTKSLDLYEDIFITFYNSCNTGFNSYPYANYAPVLKGTKAGNSKYTEEQIMCVFNILFNAPDISFNEIAEYTEVSRATIASIAAGNSHIWLKDDSPLKYIEVLKNKNNRKRITIISNKLSAKNRGIIYPKVISPIGKTYSIDNAYAFAKEHNLSGNHFQEVLNGKRKSHKGWKVWDQPEQK